MFTIGEYSCKNIFTKSKNTQKKLARICRMVRMRQMDELKNRIRKFLADTGMTRAEFADLCGICKGQLDKWLSTIPIPPRRRQLVERVIREQRAKRHVDGGEETPKIIELPVSSTRYRNMVHVAELHGLTLLEWVDDILGAVSSVRCRR